MKIQAALIRRGRRMPRFGRIRPHPKEKPPRAFRGVASLCSILCGMFSGVVLQVVFPAAVSPGLRQILTAYFDAQRASFGPVLWCCLLPSLGLGVLICYLGASPVGSPAVAALLFWRGCGLGVWAAWLAALGKTGLGFYYAVLFPAKAAQLCGLFFIARRAMALSGYYKSCLKRDSSKPEPMGRRYMISCLPGLLLLAVSAEADALIFLKLSPSFGSLAG